MPWSWSLAVEEQFYLIFPIFALLLFRYSKNYLLILTVMFIISVLTNIYAIVTYNVLLPYSTMPLFDPDSFINEWNNIYTPLYTRFGSLICGVFVAYVHHFHSIKLVDFFRNNKSAQTYLFALVILILTIVPNIPNLTTDIHYSYLFSILYWALLIKLFSLAIATLILLCLYPSNNFISVLITKILSFRIWYPIANISYSAYLIQPIIITTFYAIFLKNNVFLTPLQWTFFIFLIISSIFLVSSIFFVLIEKPILNLRK
jgi:peptidoglycan/LPS O-acetylase OafA/YrhL